MTHRLFATAGVATLLCATALSKTAPAWSEEIVIHGGDCASTLHLVSRDAPLSDVLRHLAAALHFELVDDAQSDASVTVDVTRKPVDLVADVAAAENVSMTLARNPRCPHYQRIVKVWVLPRGGAHRTSAAVTTPVRPRDRAEVEQARREKAGIDMVLRAHGVPPPLREQAESR
ncbi:MAG TPA: hypothetical protein VLN42_08650 [Casimicrobiaceae bacterium]|jgi:hypothetical protein|nr:hypothetical protein [Casimicrobiaceae bacterium]